MGWAGSLEPEPTPQSGPMPSLICLVKHRGETLEFCTKRTHHQLKAPRGAGARYRAANANRKTQSLDTGFGNRLLRILARKRFGSRLYRRQSRRFRLFWRPPPSNGNVQHSRRSIWDSAGASSRQRPCWDWVEVCLPSCSRCFSLGLEGRWGQEGSRSLGFILTMK